MLMKPLYVVLVFFILVAGGIVASVLGLKELGAGLGGAALTTLPSVLGAALKRSDSATGTTAAGELPKEP